MIVTCENCTASLQIDETKIPTKTFTVRCPKCQNVVRAQLPATSPGDTSAAPAQSAPKNERLAAVATAAPVGSPTANAAVSSVGGSVHQPTSAVEHKTEARAPNNAAVHNQSAAYTTQTNFDQAAGSRILLCLNQERRDQTICLLTDAGFEVFPAANPAAAVERLHDETVNVIVFSPNFAAESGGANVLQQQINVLPGAQRRRVFVISIDDTTATFNAHEAFMRNLNLIVNSSDINHLPSLLNRALREYKDLYLHFNKALG